MAAKQTETQQVKTTASNIILNGLHPVLLGAGGDWLKKPVETGWPESNHSLADVSHWPMANNVGIRCGLTRRGQYLYVVDFDKYADETFPRWLEAAREIIPDPVIVKTSQGYHFYLLQNQKKWFCNRVH